MLELDLNRQSIANLPAPITPTNEDQEIDNHDSEQFDRMITRGLSRKNSKRAGVVIDQVDSSDMESTHSSTDTSHLASPVDDYFGPSPTEPPVKDKSPPQQPSPERISPKREAPAPPRPVPRPDMRSKTMPTIPPRPQSVQIPTVPPRPNKQQKHLSSINITSNDSGPKEQTINKLPKLTPIEDNGSETLVAMDTSGFSSEQLQEHVGYLCDEVRKQKTQVREARQAMVDLESSHQQKILAMAQQLDQERESTQECVERIVSLQGQLNEYQLVHGSHQS